MPVEISPRLRPCLDRMIGELTEEFGGIFSRETVARYLEESLQQLDDRRGECG